MKITGLSATTYQCNKSVLFSGTRPCEDPPQRDLQVFCHHIYEYKKGLRNLVLSTEKASNKDIIEKRLKRENIPYAIHEIAENKINVYFGNQACIDVVETFDKRLNKLTPEQDFILGMMLGYDRLQQCERYLKMRKNGTKLDSLIG